MEEIQEATDVKKVLVNISVLLPFFKTNWLDNEQYQKEILKQNKQQFKKYKGIFSLHPVVVNFQCFSRRLL